MGITWLPKTSREAGLLDEVRALEARAAVLEAKNSGLQQEIALVRAQNAFLLDEAFQWKAERAQLRRQVAEQEVRIHDLERLLGRNSLNSSKPPSTDRPRRSAGASKPSGRKRGAQPGHPGSSRQSFGEPDRFVELPLDACEHCGHALDEEPALPGRLHQVAEWVERPIEVVEYHHPVKFCPGCRARVEAPYPPDVIPGSRFGPRLITIWAMFNRWGFMSVEKLEHLFSEEFGLPMAQGSITNGLLRVHEALRGPHEELRAALARQPLLHIDETAWWIEGEEHYAWTFGTERFSWLTITKHRSRYVLETVLGKDYAGPIVSDFYDVYDPYPGQRCLAHLRRDLEEAFDEPDAQDHEFAREMLQYIDAGYALWRQYQRGPDHFASLRGRAADLRAAHSDEAGHPFRGKRSPLGAKRRWPLVLTLGDRFQDRLSVLSASNLPSS